MSGMRTSEEPGAVTGAGGMINLPRLARNRQTCFAGNPGWNGAPRTIHVPADAYRRCSGERHTRKLALAYLQHDGPAGCELQGFVGKLLAVDPDAALLDHAQRL